MTVKSWYLSFPLWYAATVSCWIIQHQFELENELSQEHAYGKHQGIYDINSCYAIRKDANPNPIMNYGRPVYQKGEQYNSVNYVEVLNFMAKGNKQEALNLRNELGLQDLIYVRIKPHNAERLRATDDEFNGRRQGLLGVFFYPGRARLADGCNGTPLGFLEVPQELEATDYAEAFLPYEYFPHGRAAAWFRPLYSSTYDKLIGFMENPFIEGEEVPRIKMDKITPERVQDMKPHELQIAAFLASEPKIGNRDPPRPYGIPPKFRFEEGKFKQYDPPIDQNIPSKKPGLRVLSKPKPATLKMQLGQYNSIYEKTYPYLNPVQASGPSRNLAPSQQQHARLNMDESAPVIAMNLAQNPNIISANSPVINADNHPSREAVDVNGHYDLSNFLSNRPDRWEQIVPNTNSQENKPANQEEAMVDLRPESLKKGGKQDEEGVFKGFEHDFDIDHMFDFGNKHLTNQEEQRDDDFNPYSLMGSPLAAEKSQFSVDKGKADNNGDIKKDFNFGSLDRRRRRRK